MKEILFKNKNILITGGLGFIGAAIAKTLVKCNANVTIIDSLIPEYGGNIFNINEIRDNVLVNISDVRDIHSMKNLIQNKDYLFNLAGQTSHMDSMTDPYTDLDINAKAQLSILEAARQFNNKIKIVYASTRQIYGKPVYLPVDENHPLSPVDVNGINKLAGEQYHLLYNKVYGIPTVVLRLTNTIGQGMRIKDARQTFLGIWIKNLIEGKPIEVWGGSQLRDFNDVNDVVKAFLLAALEKKSEGKVYNLGSQEIITLKNLAELLVNIYGKGKIVIKKFPKNRKKIDIGDYYTDAGLIYKELKWEPKISLKDSLKNIMSFYNNNISQYI